MEPGTWDGCIGGGWGIVQEGETVVFGRDEAGREIEGFPVQTAHMSRVCSSGGKLVVHPACKLFCC